ncbi:MAG: hypothetical protein AAFV78_06955, partial [Bacteroidota bacterium]
TIGHQVGIIVHDRQFRDIGENTYIGRNQLGGLWYMALQYGSIGGRRIWRTFVWLRIRMGRSLYVNNW